MALSCGGFSDILTSYCWFGRWDAMVQTIRKRFIWVAHKHKHLRDNEKLQIFWNKNKACATSLQCGSSYLNVANCLNHQAMICWYYGTTHDYRDIYQLLLSNCSRMHSFRFKHFEIWLVSLRYVIIQKSLAKPFWDNWCGNRAWAHFCQEVNYCTGSGRWGQAMWDFTHTHIAYLVVKGLCFRIAWKILYQWKKTKKQTGLFLFEKERKKEYLLH